jgi:hypothetical protein
VGRHEKQRAEAGERLASATVTLAMMHERGVGAEGDVVQKQPLARPANVNPAFIATEGRERRERICAVEAEVAREMVPRPEGNTDERQLALDRDLSDRSERPVATRDADRVGEGARSHESRRMVAFSKHTRLDSSLVRRSGKLVGAGSATPRARVDQEKACQAGRA